MPLKFRILGPFELLDESAAVRLTAHKPRALLAMLLVHNGQLVSWQQLLDELWGSAPPRSAISNLRTYTTELRRLAFRGGGRLAADPGGYRMQLDRAVVDLEEFDRLCAQARSERQGGLLTAASASYDRALGLWRGPPLAGLQHGPSLTAVATALEERRAGVIEDAFDARLDLSSGGEGDVSKLVASLRRHVAAYPLRERSRRQLMVALYRAGDVAGALAAGAAASETLRSSLGLDPDHRIEHLHVAILRRDPKLRQPGIQDLWNLA